MPAPVRSFKRYWLFSVLPIAATAWLQALPTAAQIVGDTTLPNNSIVTPTGATCTPCTLSGGTQVGGNLFHSFTQFSVVNGETAFFDNNAATIQNIFARVTGGSASTIDGILQANGTANLFLLNPNGLTFGSGATLQLGGSFFGSTADSIQFQDGTTFSATAPTPLLTVSVPVGLQYGANPGAIQVNGPGHNLAIGGGFAINRSARPAGLAVNPGQTLALIGGEVNLDGGNLTADQGRIEVGSVTAAQLVDLTNTLGVSYSQVSDFGNIRLANAASIDTSSSTANNGAINIQGKSLQVQDGSAIIGLTLGSGQGQPITINTTDRILVTGLRNGNIFPSFVSTDIGLTAAATAIGGDIKLNTGLLQASDGGIISASTLRAGQAGNVEIKASQINLSGEIPAVGAQSGIFSQVINRTATGDAGIITINTDSLNVSNGAQVVTATSGRGNSGSLAITAKSVNLDGSGVRRASGLFASGAGGNGGPITVTSDQLSITNGAQINSSTRGPGDGGIITIQATNSTITGIGPSGPSGIFSTVSGGGSGAAGAITLSGDQLFVGDGAQIATATSWSGDAGDITVRVKAVELAGGNPQSLGGLISTSVLILPPPNVPVPPPAQTGQGGTISVTADRLIVRDGAVINVSNLPTSSRSSALPGNGSVGNIAIQANSVLLDNGGTLTATSRGGDRGNITINGSQNVTLRNASLITGNADGTATGGNITINTPFLIGPALENSDITANSTNNFGGQVEINGQNVLGIRPAPQLTPASDITASSALGVQFNGDIRINTLNADPEQGVAELPNYLLDRAQQVAQTCAPNRASKFVITGRGGIPVRPTEQIDTALTWQDFRAINRTIRTGTIAQPPAAITPASIPQPLIEATQWERTASGEIRIIAQTNSPQRDVIASALTCATAQK
ncbi:S-layer family protein [filamentous cyanobacterium LEGE 11480]|uniref:S-layer family protein n=1 Tax=Romeriopsis navalis LEGE 11480 TaxID=2777977 RepID=A0A928Z5A8_9CYAN|nr:S-layer family protein [Romeriopsis navalis]MBE9031278.1 S-layer family protein [Romeriopsis navalis LEGE 11480]